METTAALALNAVDRAGLSLVLSLAHRSEVFDWALRFVLTVDFVKLGVPVLLVLYAWLAVREDEPAERRTRRVLGSLVGVIIAIGIGRLVQDGLPPRARPRVGLPEVAFPSIGDLPNLAEWSSFPSDHAALAAALATAAWAFSWRLGLASAFWGVFVIAFPRLYFGYHYVTDLLGGAVLGFVLTRLVMALPFPQPALLAFGRVQRQAPVLLSLVVFAIAYEFISLFATMRRVLGAVKDVVDALG